MSKLTPGPRRIAALDCGTNSTRLLVTDHDGRSLERLVTITRLGKGVDATGRLDEAAVDRTVDTLRHYRAVMDSYGVSSVRLVATSAARDASNYEMFSNRVREAIGVEPELLSGREEGTLAFLGATAELDDGAAGPPAGPRLVVDIGGGSTELIAGIAGRAPEFVVSLDMGCVRITEKFLTSDPPGVRQVEAARSEICSLLGRARTDAAAGYRPDAFEDHGLIGVAGTVTTLCTMSLGLDAYDPEKVHHAILSRDEVSRLFGELVVETADQRRHHRGLEPGRADVIAAGALILLTVMDVLDFSYLLVSESDILDGLVADQLRNSGT